MAHRAYFCVDLFCRAAGLECIAAAAVYHYFFVIWMYLFFHKYSVLRSTTTKDESVTKYLKLRILTILMHISTKIFCSFYLAPSSGRGCKREERFLLHRLPCQAGFCVASGEVEWRSMGPLALPGFISQPPWHPASGITLPSAFQPLFANLIIPNINFTLDQITYFFIIYIVLKFRRSILQNGITHNTAY